MGLYRHDQYTGQRLAQGCAFGAGLLVDGAGNDVLPWTSGTGTVRHDDGACWQI